MEPKKTNCKYKFVMLIDDVELDNFINEKLIHSASFAETVYINSSASSALEFLNNIAKASKHFPEVCPDVIFVDINMPLIDGFQFISTFSKVVEQQVKKPQLVILTSSVAEIDRIKTQQISEDILFFNKPLTKKILDSI